MSLMKKRRLAEPTTEDSSIFMCLPNELLRKVFELLEYPSTLSHVSKRWNKLWTLGVSFKNLPNNLVDEVRDIVISPCFPLLSWRVAGFFEGITQFLTRRCQHLANTVDLGVLFSLEEPLQNLFLFSSSLPSWIVPAAICTRNSLILRISLLNHTIIAAIDVHEMFRMACEKGYHEIVKILLRDLALDPSWKENIAIQVASENGHHETVAILLEDPRVDPSANNNYAVEVASQQGRLMTLELLLRDLRVDPSANDNYAIQFASRNGHHLVVERLLQDPRVDPSVDNNYSIRLASKKGHYRTVTRLLQDPRVDPSADNNEAFRSAKEAGYHRVVECLEKDERVRALEEMTTNGGSEQPHG